MKGVPRWFARKLVEELAGGWLIDRDKDFDWAVYEDRTGTLHRVTPPTYANARHEADLAGQGHRCVPFIVGRQMANAYNHGRHEAIRKSSGSSDG